MFDFRKVYSTYMYFDILFFESTLYFLVPLLILLGVNFMVIGIKKFIKNTFKQQISIIILQLTVYGVY